MKLLISISLLAILFVIACKDTDNPGPQSGGQIPETSAKRLVKNYEPCSHHPILDSTSKCKSNFDARFVWFHKDQLKALLKSVDSIGGDGIRFYLAAYDTKINEVPVDPQYLGYTTLVMVATKAGPPVDGKPTHIDDLGNNNQNRKSLFVILPPENQGELCPPPDKCDNSQAKLLD